MPRAIIIPKESKEVPYTTCTLGNIRCRHCSDEYYYNCSKVSDIRTHKVIRLNKNIHLGLYCNNSCTWVSNLTVCPIAEAREICRIAIATYDPEDPLRWMSKKVVSNG